MFVFIFTESDEEMVRKKRKKGNKKKQTELQEDCANHHQPDTSTDPQIVRSNIEPELNDEASSSTKILQERTRPNPENMLTNEIMNEEFIGPHGKPRKNRFADPKVWKKNVRKHLRNSGESYVGVKGKIVPKKMCEDFDCHCRLKCSQNISYAERCKNFQKFYSNAAWETQTAILASAVKVVRIKRKRKQQDSRRSETREYYLKSESNDVLVCKAMFMKTLDVNSTRIHRALLKAKNENSFTDKRGKAKPANATSDDKLLKVRQHIESFPAYKSHYRRSDTPDCKYLSSELNMTKMYEMYKKSIENEHRLENHDDSVDAWQAKCVSINTYKRIFRRDFNLKFKSPKKDTCKKCDRLKILIDAEELKPNPERNTILAKLKAEQELHHRQAEKSTAIRDQDVEVGKTDDVHVISFDLQKVFPIPKITTNEAYYKRQLSVLNFGIQDLTSEQAYMYVWHEGIASRGPQEVASCLKMYVKKYVQCNKLIAWSDSCGGQNRNIKIVLAYMYLVAQPDILVDTIIHKFCVSGHSYLPNDRDFSQIENKIRKKDNVYSFDEFVEIIKSSKQNQLPFKVTKMSGDDFISTKKLEQQITNRKKDVQKQTVSWMRMMEIKVQKDKPGILQFKYTHDKDVPYYEVDIRKKLTGLAPDFAGQTLDHLHPQGHVISEEKLKDIKHLLKYVPEIYHDFYLKLMPTQNVDQEDSDGVILEDDFFQVEDDYD